MYMLATVKQIVKQHDQRLVLVETEDGQTTFLDESRLQTPITQADTLLGSMNHDKGHNAFIGYQRFNLKSPNIPARKLTDEELIRRLQNCEPLVSDFNELIQEIKIILQTNQRLTQKQNPTHQYTKGQCLYHVTYGSICIVSCIKDYPEVYAVRGADNNNLTGRVKYVTESCLKTSHRYFSTDNTSKKHSDTDPLILANIQKEGDTTC